MPIYRYITYIYISNIHIYIYTYILLINIVSDTEVKVLVYCIKYGRIWVFSDVFVDFALMRESAGQ